MRARRAAILALTLFVLPAPARAVLDVRDRGPTLRSPAFELRVTNAGILGNAFLDRGLSNDPSLEFPTDSGHEALNYAALWVGALSETGDRVVSGGPLLEFRPTIADDDRVRIVDHDRPGGRRFEDDDADGRVDEEILNGRDDDGDGEVDEDLGLFAARAALSDYVDDRPEAIAFVYPNGEKHHALGLSVHEEVYQWEVPGYDRFAGITWTITNHGTRRLQQLYVGLYADLDSRDRNDRAGHLNDRVADVSYPSSTAGSGPKLGTPCLVPGSCDTRCFAYFGQTLPAVFDGVPGSGLPAVTIVPLGHTIDPLALLEPAAATRAARAPGRVAFRSRVFEQGLLAAQGGVPSNDAQRYAALAGELPGAATDHPGDYAVLVSCGPFAYLDPGQSIEFSAALVVADDVDSLPRIMATAANSYNGQALNLLPDLPGNAWYIGETGKNGHEVCLEPPPGVSFHMDPHCPQKFDDPPPPFDVLYQNGTCVWTDADCSSCSGRSGNDTIVRWLDPGSLPPAPSFRAVAADRRVRIEWDNMPEILFNAGLSIPASARTESRFMGYRVYRLADWRHRASLLPPQENWALVGTFAFDTLNGEHMLSSVTDSSVEYDLIHYRQPHYPVGRYVAVDSDLLDGFDYVYAVTTRYEIRQRDASGQLSIRLIESPIEGAFVDRVTPHAAARADAKGVWVVPNPFKAKADWDRPRTLGDELTRHLDFMGLPRALCTIKIWTVAGDLVAILQHDGRNGDGEAPWDLVSRNGQEVESGIYLFTVDSALGHQVGRFVVIR
jgi:hypothetical protein